MVTTVMSMLIVPILLEVLSAPVGLALKEVAQFAEVSNSIVNTTDMASLIVLSGN